MHRTIKKHPLAFLHCLGWLCAGIAMGYIMHHESSDYYDVPYADAAVILFMAGFLLIVSAPVIGLVVKLIRQSPPATRRERAALRANAKWFESTRPGLGWYYLMAVLAGVLPILAMLSVLWVDSYMPAVLLSSIGIAIWLCFECYEWAENKLLRVTDIADRFHLQTDASTSLLDRLTQRGLTFGIPQALWDGRRDHLYNMLLQQGIIDDRSTVTGYVFPIAALEEHIGLGRTDTASEDVVWIPFGQFYSGVQGKGYMAIRKMFLYDLASIADRRYENNRETESGAYPHSSTEARLLPDETAALYLQNGQLYLFANSAESFDEEEDCLYRGCMLHIGNAVLEDVKWDYFETAGEPGDDREHYLTPEEARSLYRLLLEGAFSYEICDLTYLEDKQQLAIEVWLDPEDPSGLPLEGEAVSFAPDDELGYLLLLSYDQLRWHWMKDAPAQSRSFSH